MAGEGVTAMIVAADAGDNPLADRREDLKAAAERERKAKVAKVASQATNAMAAVRAQLDLRKVAADKAANKANDDAGAPVRASSTMLERVFDARLDGPDKYVVARRKERKTAAGAGTAADLAAGLEKMTDSVVKMARRDGADGNTVTAEHKALLDDVAVEQGRKAIVARAASNYRQHTAWLATFATFVQCFYPCGWRHPQPAAGWKRGRRDSYRPAAGGSVPGDGGEQAGAVGRVCVRPCGRDSIVCSEGEEGGAHQAPRANTKQL